MRLSKMLIQALADVECECSAGFAAVPRANTNDCTGYCLERYDFTDITQRIVAVNASRHIRGRIWSLLDLEAVDAVPIHRRRCFKKAAASPDISVKQRGVARRFPTPLQCRQRLAP